jgi:hypothetical protein
VDTPPPIVVPAPALACVDRPVSAWTPGTPPATWKDSALPVTFTPALPLFAALGQDAAVELAVAARTWSEVACTSFRATVATPATLVAADDGVNGVFFHEDAWPAELDPGALGQTVLHVDAQGNLHDADIHINGVDWRFSLDGAGSTIDLRGVLLHEMGHALGLGHSAEARATMHASHPPGLAWRSLEKDDEDGVCTLYPGTGAPRCDTGDACPSGFVCVARACERRGTRGEVCAPCDRAAGACEGSGDDARCNDLPGGGRVCGRACASDAECGPRFACAPQTAAGDLQCVPTDGCASGPDPCVRDADCDGGAACRSGACVGVDPTTPEAGAPPDASVRDTPISSGGGCALSRRANEQSPPFALAVALLALARRLRVTKLDGRGAASRSASSTARR